MINQILYFIEGPAPTTKEFEKAEKFMNKGPMLQFVSIQEMDLNGPLRENVGVAGLVPEAYKHFELIDKSKPILIPQVQVDKK